MLRRAFETEILDDGDNLIGPWRCPRQMLADQVYDDHVSIHDDATARRLGFKGGTIEGPTHFSQFAPLGERLWGDAWFETGCLSAHYRNAAVEGEEVQAVIVKPPPGAREAEIRMIKRNDADSARHSVRRWSRGPDGAGKTSRRRAASASGPGHSRRRPGRHEVRAPARAYEYGPDHGRALPILPAKQARRHHRAFLALRPGEGARKQMGQGSHSHRDAQRPFPVHSAR